MGQYIEESFKSGTLVATEGCLPSGLGARVRLSKGKFSVTDGPFTESKELIRRLRNYPGKFEDTSTNCGRICKHYRIDPLSWNRNGGYAKNATARHPPGFFVSLEWSCLQSLGKHSFIPRQSIGSSTQPTGTSCNRTMHAPAGSAPMTAMMSGYGFP